MANNFTSGLFGGPSVQDLIGQERLRQQQLLMAAQQGAESGTERAAARARQGFENAIGTGLMGVAASGGPGAKYFQELPGLTKARKREKDRIELMEMFAQAEADDGKITEAEYDKIEREMLGRGYQDAAAQVRQRREADFGTKFQQSKASREESTAKSLESLRSAQEDYYRAQAKYYREGGKGTTPASYPEISKANITTWRGALKSLGKKYDDKLRQATGETFIGGDEVWDQGQLDDESIATLFMKSHDFVSRNLGSKETKDWSPLRKMKYYLDKNTSNDTKDEGNKEPKKPKNSRSAALEGL